MMKVVRSQMNEEEYSLTKQVDITFVKSPGKSTDVGDRVLNTG